MKNFIKVVNKHTGEELRINVNNIIFYDLENGYDDVTYIRLVDGAVLRVLATAEEIDSKIDECLC